MSSVLKALGVSALAVALGGISQPAQASPCLAFEGLQHCAFGNASLAINGQGNLVVSGANSQSGVSIATPGATSWSNDSRVKLRNGIGDALNAQAIAQGQVASTTQALGVAGGFRLSATFTASSGTPKFTTRVYRDGVLVGTSSGNPSGGFAARIDVPVLVSGWVLTWPDFYDDDGDCSWVYQTPAGANYMVTLPNGQAISGDEVRIVEELSPGGGYPYATFDGIKLSGNTDPWVFFSEDAQ